MKLESLVQIHLFNKVCESLFGEQYNWRYLKPVLPVQSDEGKRYLD